MALTVVLIRHGEAKRKEFGQTDFDRELTSLGAKELEEHFPRALSLLEVTAASELWVSPAKRARQTAQIANQTLGIETYREIRSLYDQDEDAFLEELSRCNADVVVVVGHIPFMEDVCARLCGQFMSFSTGAAAAISIDDKKVHKVAKSRVHGRLRWYVQGPLT